MNVERWQKAFDIGEGDWLVLINQIPDEKACPRVSRFRIGNDKNVSRKNGYITASRVPVISSGRTPILGSRRELA